MEYGVGVGVGEYIPTLDEGRKEDVGLGCCIERSKCNCKK